MSELPGFPSANALISGHEPPEAHLPTGVEPGRTALRTPAGRRPDRMNELPSFHAIQTLIEEFRNGRMVILVDDESRENEGDLIIAAQHVQPHHIKLHGALRARPHLPPDDRRTVRPDWRAADGRAQHRAAPHDVHGLDRRGGGGGNRDFGP